MNQSRAVIWRRWPSRLAGICTSTAMILGATDLVQAQLSSAYEVGPGDQLRIAVYGEPQLSGLFKISADGLLSYPLLGNVPVEHMTVAKVIEVLRAKLSEQIPTGNSLTVEVGQYAGVFVIGDVEKSGLQEYRPGMTVLELVALAGGLRRASAEDSDKMTRFLATEQDLKDLQLERYADLVERARLQAEISGMGFDAAKRPADDAILPNAAARIVADEVLLFESRKLALAETKASMRSQMDAVDGEILTLKESIGLHESEIKLIQQEIDTQSGLVDKGIATAARLQALRRELAGALRLSLDIRAAAARASQNRLQIVKNLAETDSLRAKENAITLRNLDVRLARMDENILSKQAIAAETQAQLESPRPRGRRPIAYTRIRLIDGLHDRRSVDEFSALKAGDILKVDSGFETFSDTVPGKGASLK